MIPKIQTKIFRAVRIFGLLGLWIITWVLCVYLSSDIAPPLRPATSSQWNSAQRLSHWFDRSEYKINHIFLHGSSFERGLAWGALSGDRLYRQEKHLQDLYQSLLPSWFARKVFELIAMRVFKGVENSIDKDMLEEMWGVSQNASSEFNHLASPFARQVAYHGIHEVGQMFVDFAPASYACTFVATPWVDAENKRHWIVGRTFDFEGGRIFDEEKVLKWVNPQDGYKYVSVIWTGMVGAVSGVNEKGIYVSLNAAGSKDMQLHGLPSTLLVTKMLQRAGTAAEALKILRDTQIMIADIFLLLDSNTQRLYKIEKSADHMDVSEISSARAVANYLEVAAFKDDSFNRFRFEKLTSTYRQKRAQALVEKLSHEKIKSEHDVSAALLQILRDKGKDDAGHDLHLGNRRAIDALIAAHGVVFDSKRQILYVGEGPAMGGKFHGFDVRRSFASDRPVEIDTLGADVRVTPEIYANYTVHLHATETAIELANRGECSTARELLAPLQDFVHVEKEIALWKLANCEHNEVEAQAAIRRALVLSPPYKDTEDELRKALR